MNKIIYVLFATLAFANTAAAYPYIIRVLNKLDEPLLIQDNGQTVFQIDPNKRTEFVVTHANNYRARYLTGKKLVHDESINALTTECNATRLKHTDEDLLICQFSFEKKRSKSGYEFNCDYDLKTPYKTADFRKIVQEVSGDSPVCNQKFDLTTMDPLPTIKTIATFD